MPVAVTAVKIAGKQADILKRRIIKIRTRNIITTTIFKIIFV
ncbi:hypothetical protein H377_4810 [Rickettsia prowazekii str. Cairo 3]|nr:hypothetical protein H377_4810 [Rickettsia prowazekii str. Cairo 3]